MKFLAALSILSFFAAASAEAETGVSGYVFRPSYELFRSANYEGNMVGLQIQKGLLTNLDLSLGARRLSRTFTGGTKIEETAFDFGSVYKYQKNIYVESGVSYVPNALILPVSSVYVTPHWVHGAGDLSLGMSFSRYKLVDAGYLHPNYFYEFSEHWRGEFGLYFLRTDHFLNASHGDFTYSPNENHSLRFDAANGTSLEDAGVEAKFTSFSLEYGFHQPRWAVFISTSDYRSDIRHENSFGLRLEIR